MYKRVITGILLIEAHLVALGCSNNPGEADSSKSADLCAADTSAWSAPNFSTNANEALGLRANLDALVQTMRQAEEETVAVTGADLETLFAQGMPSVQSTAHDGYAGIVDNAFDDFVALVDEGVQLLVDDGGNWNPGEHGGIYGSDARGINAGGLEVRQLVDKGLFGGGALYHYALNQTEAMINDQVIDQLAAAYGASATLESDDITDSADYCYSMGFHGRITEALVSAKEHQADSECGPTAVVAFFRAWESCLFARALYYLHDADLLLSEARNDDEIANALHELAEGAGLMLGYLEMPQPSGGPLAAAGRLSTDEQIESMAQKLGIRLDALNDSTVGVFVDRPEELTKVVQEIRDMIQITFGFSADDMQAIYSPTEG